MDQVELGVRVAEAGDVDAVVATLTSAFFDDPMWGPVFPEVERRSEQASALWRFFVTSSLKFRWTFVTADAGATAVWIPPGEVELTPAEEADLERLLVDVTGREVAADVMATLALFEDAHPAEPHCYLSLLGTNGTHRGRGIGMALLRDNLARIDALGLPAYLESSNPANDKRYESVGFRPYATIVAASGHAMTTMWRPARTG